MHSRKILTLVFLIVLTLLSIRSFFSSGFFPMHDDAQVARVIVMAHALKNGQFPVRMVSDLGYGYGYPIFNFYGPLPYYVGGVLHVIGIDALTATKIMIGLGMLIGSLSMYFCSSFIFGTLGGIFSTILFTFFPYRAVQVYVRGAIGEMWAVSLLPLVLFGLVRLIQENSKTKGMLISIMALSAVILSHTVLGYVATGSIMVVACVLFVFSTIGKRNDLRHMSLSFFSVGLLSLGVTAFFWLPAIVDMPYTNVYKVIGKTAEYTDHYICISQLWDSLWGFGGSAPGCLDGMSFKLGKLHILSVIVSLGLWLSTKMHGKRMYSFMGVLFISLVTLVFLTLQISQPVWDRIPFSSFIQYPWRLLGPIGVCIALIGGYLFYKKNSMLAYILLFVFGGSIIFFNLKLFSPQYLYSKPAESFENFEELRFRASQVSDEYLPKDIKIPENPNQVISERVTGSEFIHVKKIRETEIYGIYEITSIGTQSLKLNMAYYPGWTYRINNQKMEPEVVQGEPSVILSSGANLLEMRFSDTIEMKIGNGISFIALWVIIILMIYGKKIIRYYRHTRL